MGEIVWLASYPKSGNTWLRVFLSNLLRAEQEAVDINALEVNLIAASRIVFEDITGIDSTNLSDEETNRLRPAVFEHFARQADHTLFVKIHDGYRHPCAERPIIPPAVTRAVVYVVRNPLDVAVSYAHHSNRSVDRIIQRMADEEYCMAGQGRNHLGQWLGSWSSHVTGWADAAEVPVHVLRYEDLSANAFEEFTTVARLANIPAGADDIRRAIGFSSFDVLRRQEQESGFAERTARDTQFFRSGRAGSWRDAMTAEQAAQIVACHHDVMRRFGYIDERGDPVF
jgi:hypothetical protein